MFRNFKDLAQWIGGNLPVENAVIDGEIACVDDSGRSIFNDLLFRRRECLLLAFDLLFLNGEDLRGLPLVERKARMKRLLRRKRSRILYMDHIEARGLPLFEKICALDLEGIVAKRKDSLYRATDKPSPYWIKIKNRNYTQAEGREELFDPALRTANADKLRRAVTSADRRHWRVRRISSYALRARGLRAYRPSAPRMADPVTRNPPITLVSLGGERGELRHSETLSHDMNTAA